MKSLGDNIRKYRKQLGITQKELAEKCGFSTGTIQQYELGKREPKSERLHIVAKALGVSIFELLDTREYELDHKDRITINEMLSYYSVQELKDIIINMSLSHWEVDDIIDKSSNVGATMLKKISKLNTSNKRKLIDYLDYLIYRQESQGPGSDPDQEAPDK